MNSVKFLTESDIQKEVRRIMTKDGEALIAVAFWGLAGAKTAGLTDRVGGKTRILCDLFSGSCNPNEMHKLSKDAGISMRTLDGMHAKVWCVENEIIIGSANASENGLGFEGTESAGNTEAAIFIDDSVVAGRVREWFENCRNNVQTRPIGPKEIESTRALWKSRREQWHRQSTTTLIPRALTSDPYPRHGRA